MQYSQFNSIVPLEDKYALYNSYSNKVILIETDLKELLNAAIEEGVDNLEEVHPDFYHYLIENEFLIEQEVNEVEKVKMDSTRVDENPNMFFLTINPTMNCNFKCWYCYETHIKKSKMEHSVLDSVNLFIKKTIRTPQINNFILSFFGGEPLLYFNQNVTPIIQTLISEIEKEKDNKKIHFNISFTTNGLLINEEFINFFLNNKLNVGLQITFDGYKEEHDEVRYVSKTRGSYSNIVENIKKILSYDNFFVQARINYTDKNICNAFKIVDDFTDISEHAKKNQLVFDFHRVWQNSKLDDVSEILLESCEKMKEKGFRTHIQYTPNNVKDSCYADKRNSATINYNGDIFKCTARDFSQENRSGYLTQEGDLVWENDSLEKRMNAKFRNRPCLSCKILPLCNGGCTQHAVEHYEIDDDYCVYYGDESEKNKIIYAKIEEILHV